MLKTKWIGKSGVAAALLFLAGLLGISAGTTRAQDQPGYPGDQGAPGDQGMPGDQSDEGAGGEREPAEEAPRAADEPSHAGPPLGEPARPVRLRRRCRHPYVPQMFPFAFMRPPGLPGQALGVAGLHR